MRQAISQAILFVRLNKCYRKYRPYTMIKPARRFVENLLLAKITLENRNLKDGAIVECGTWKGGMAAALVEIGGPKRRYYFFDSFAGLPAPTAQDGDAAIVYQGDTANPEFHDNCTASLDDIKSALSLTGCPPSQISIIPGFFEQSFQYFEPPKIAVLRLDADWHSSTLICLKKFWRHVLPNGLILLDDYYTWEGCTRAVHEFLASEGASERIEQGRISGAAFIRKLPLRKISPREARLVMADEDLAV
jgi:O-methyltransferase